MFENLRHYAFSQSPINLEQTSRWIFVLSNRERGHRGIAPLQRLSKLDQVAALYSENMARLNFFDHQDPEKRGPQERLQQLCPELVGCAGENIALFPTGPEEDLAHSLVDGWMNSPGHRRNLLSPTFTHLGIGLCQSRRQVYATQSFACLYAELLNRRPPISVRLGESCTLRFYFFNRFDRTELAILLEFPDPLALVPVDNGRYFKGACPQNLKWESDRTFRILPSLNCGRGAYKLYAGDASLDTYCPTAVVINVR
jgi:Cysteine-rich secretory protein family